MMFSTPSSLLQRLQLSPEAGDWERFVDLYAPVLFAWTERLELSDHDAADLVQDVFATLVEKLPAFPYDENKSFRAWLKTVLLNRWRQWRRKGAAARRVGGDSALADLPGEPEDPDFDEVESRRQLAQRALAIMQADFEPTTWKACWELVVHERPAAAVAAELDLTVNAVYLAKTRILRRLREELRGLLD
jgi:RNA polymerase sigma-70 factor (ECF subfamily)